MKRLINKKGVSPLIEYVLLISTGLFLGAIFYLAVNNYIGKLFPSSSCSESISIMVSEVECGAKKVLDQSDYYVIFENNTLFYKNGIQACNTLGASCDSLYKFSGGIWHFINADILNCSSSLTTEKLSNLSIDYLAAKCTNIQTDWGLFLNIKNRGKFDIPSYKIRAGFIEKNDLINEDISSYLVNSSINVSDYIIKDKLLVAQNKSYLFNLSKFYSDKGEPQIFTLQITPQQYVEDIKDKKIELISCENSLIKIDVSNCLKQYWENIVMTPTTCYAGGTDNGDGTCTLNILATNDNGMQSYDTSYTTARNANAGGDWYGSDQTSIGQAFWDPYYYSRRAFFSFAIPDIKDLTSALLYLDGVFDQSTTDFDVYIHTSTHSLPILLEDFDQFDGWQASGAYTGTILNNVWNSASFSLNWNNITFNAAGLSAILTKKNTNFTMVLISKEDYINSAPSTISTESLGFRRSNGPANERPYLSITYPKG